MASPFFRQSSGGRVQRDRPLTFTFDGKKYSGCLGDTLASALLANGVHLVGRSFKYHRPRGIMSAGSDEPNALVGVGHDEAHYTPNLRATQVELFDGLVAESQNRFPSLKFDFGASNELLAPFIPAGFYYKTFMWPKQAWKRLYEPFIRSKAGLGRAPKAEDADHYEQVYAHCDILIVGSGPAGLAAALAAAPSGARIILCDEQAELGGSLLAETAARIDGKPASDWLDAALREIASHPNVKILPRTTAFGWYPHNFLGLCERLNDHRVDRSRGHFRERLWQVRAKEIVLATGAIERPLVFPGNDRPGVMMADAARTYLNRYGVLPGRRALVFTAHDGAYRAALELQAAGVQIAGIADLRANLDGYWVTRARENNIDVRAGTTITGTRGRLRIKSADLATFDGERFGSAETISCDLLLMSGGFTPSVHLFSQSGGKLAYDEVSHSFLPNISVERERSVGACRGVFGLAEVMRDGFSGGADALQKAVGQTPPVNPCEFALDATAASSGGFVGAVPHNRNPLKTRAWVDFQNDVTSKDVALATREGFRSIEHVKRYTTTGMATDQGKTSNMNALAVVSKILDTPIPNVGLTTFRPPYTPVTFGTFAGISRGELFAPVCRTPIHAWAEENGAVFEDVGLWKRARYFPQTGEDMHAAVTRECIAARQSAGIFDGSTLGKIEVVGKDAAEFMNRMYTNDWSKLKPGRLRYGVMLREDGFVMDDGVVGRMAEDRFHVTTTTGGAARVLAVMEDYLQTEWPDLDVWLTSITEQWAVIAVQGPMARKVLEPFIEGIDLSAAAMPHMSVCEGSICNVPTRLFRVSFTGELGYEINVPSGYGRAIWEKVFAEGKKYGITPYGTEAMHVLRAEKGYIIVGQETDGTVTPDDVGLGWAISKTKPDFVGKRSLKRLALSAAGRKQLVGLLTVDPSIILDEVAQIVSDPVASISMPMVGHVTSSYWSGSLSRSIALALVQNGRARIGQRLWVPMPERSIEVEVVQPVFYDAKGERLNA